VAPRGPRAVLLANPYCAPLRAMYDRLATTQLTSWNQVESEFLAAMSMFDSGLPSVLEGAETVKNRQSKELSAAIQNA
jgi:hypothetical protein